MAAGFMVALWEQPAHAYLDPGSGSMLLQLILGGVAAVGVTFRLFWQRWFQRVFTGFRRHDGEDSP
jgi:hypothetical protein